MILNSYQGKIKKLENKYCLKTVSNSKFGKLGRVGSFEWFKPISA